ncbi:MAG: hypothetical protein K0U93_15560 [Gammaproteobacteria bacterium]|nr:hypothetical protein [Gammaproteobacteria bacterium]
MKRYLITFGITVVVWMMAAGAINLIVDPFGFWEIVRVEGFNDTKPAATKRTRIVKSYAVLRAEPRTIIAGNSRPEMGIDPAAQEWPDDWRPVYSLTLPGAYFRLQVMNAAHAIANGGVKHVFLGVDFLDFLVPENATISARELPEKIPETQRLLLQNIDVPNPTRFISQGKDAWASLFSLDALVDSGLNVLARGDATASTVRADGFNPARDYEAIVRTEGQRALFAHKYQEIVARLVRRPLQVFQGGERWSRDFELLRRFLDDSKRRGITVTLFINPYHADYLDLITYADYWERFEEWKRVLATLAHDAQTPLWDFSGYDTFSTDNRPVPPLNALRWFWEPAHYRAELGSRMLARMVAGSTTSSNSLGVLLTPDNVETRLRSTRVARAAYWETQPAHTDSLKTLVRKRASP